MMAAPEPQPRFGQSVKGLLSEKVGSCSGDVITLTRQVLKGSRSQELLGQAARNMVMQEDAILHSEDPDYSTYSPAITDSFEAQRNSILRYFAIFRDFSRVPDFQIYQKMQNKFKKNVNYNNTPAVSARSHTKECGTL